MVHYWRIAAFVGTIIFAVSGILPVVSGSYSSASLFDVYYAIMQGYDVLGPVTLNAATVGIVLTIVLYPIGIVLGLASLIRRKIALLAGILGLVCWIGTLTYLAQYDFLSYAGIGIYVGIVGAIIIELAYFLKPSAAAPPSTPAPATSPPPPPSQ